MYCEQCGTNIEPQSKFCAKCGALVAKTPDLTSDEHEVSSPTGELDTSEKVVWVLTAQRKISFYKSTACYVVFMRDKAIVAHLSPELQKAENSKNAQRAKSKGLGFLKSSAAMMQYWSKYYKKYYSMTTEQILSEDSTNFIISYLDIKKVLYQCESLTNDPDDIAYGSQGKLNITIHNGKAIKFSHNHTHSKSVKETLIDLFSKKLKYKK